jgi:hypothetical protein
MKLNNQIKRLKIASEKIVGDILDSDNIGIRFARYNSSNHFRIAFAIFMGKTTANDIGGYTRIYRGTVTRLINESSYEKECHDNEIKRMEENIRKEKDEDDKKSYIKRLEEYRKESITIPYVVTGKYRGKPTYSLIEEVTKAIPKIALYLITTDRDMNASQLTSMDSIAEATASENNSLKKDLLKYALKEPKVLKLLKINGFKESIDEIIKKKDSCDYLYKEMFGHLDEARGIRDSINTTGLSPELVQIIDTVLNQAKTICKNNHLSNSIHNNNNIENMENFFDKMKNVYGRRGDMTTFRNECVASLKSFRKFIFKNKEDFEMIKEKAKKLTKKEVEEDD